jgi:hypothetical protein
VDWIPAFDEKRTRYAEGEERARGDERALVRQGNVAYAAGLALLMAGSADAGAWLRRAAGDWRTSWDAGAPRDAWGRPIGVLKALLLAGDEAAVAESARWALELGCATAESPIGRYAGCLALLASERWPEARHVAESLRERDDFPHDVADALATIAAHDLVGAIEAIESVVTSFEVREAYLEDMAVADTALVLAELARLRGVPVELAPSAVLPADRTG